MIVSVIIPIYKDWEGLQGCLKALNEQSFNSADFEVIIVNNDVDDTIKSTLSFPKNYVLTTESKPGSYAARNAGLKMAKGDIIGFTDSDCVPDKDWIKNAVNHLLANPLCSRVAGNVSIQPTSSKPSIVDNYNRVYSFPQKWLVKNGGGSVTANLFTYRHVFEKVGYFDENLLSMGDKSWGMLAQKAGYRIDYVSNVIVYHPARSLKELIKKERRHGGAVAIKPGKNKWTRLIHFLFEFRPRISGFTFLFSKTQELRLIDRLAIPLLRHYLILVRAYEKFRVHGGKKANRA